MNQRVVAIAEAIAMLAFISGGGCTLLLLPRLGHTWVFPIALVIYGVLIGSALLTYFLGNRLAKLAAGIVTSGLLGAYVMSVLIDHSHFTVHLVACGLFILLVFWGISLTERARRSSASQRNSGDHPR